MHWRNTREHYGSAAIGLHWLMLLILVAVYASIEMRTFFPKGSDPRELMKLWHFMLGLSVLTLVSIRAVIHVIGPSPLFSLFRQNGRACWPDRCISSSTCS